MKKTFRNGGGNTKVNKKKAFFGTAWDEKHVRVEAGGS